jgi:S1-C subfamily serine protease
MGLLPGDRIVSLGDQTFASCHDHEWLRFVRLIREAGPGARIALTIVRDGKHLTLSGALGQFEP